MLISPEARAAIQHYFSSTNILHALELHAIFETARALDSEGVAFSLEALSGRLEPRLQRILTELSFSDAGVREEDAPQQALHCLRALETKSLNLECEALRRRIRDSEQNGNIAEAMRLTDELDKIKRASSAP